MRRASLPPELAGLVDAPRPVDEFLRRVQAPPTPEEIETTAELVAWFTRRYPTVRARLTYARQAYARWTRPLGSTLGSAARD